MRGKQEYGPLLLLSGGMSGPAPGLTAGLSLFDGGFVGNPRQQTYEP